MFLGRGGSRNYRIKGGPSLIDVLVVLYLLFYRVFQLTIPRELKFPRMEGESKFLGAVGSW